MNKADRDHLDRVANLGCIVCRLLGYGYREAEIHHLKHGPETGGFIGTGKRSSHQHVIPLCPTHHRHGGFGVAYHGGPRAFAAKYGAEEYLYRKVQEMLENMV